MRLFFTSIEIGRLFAKKGDGAESGDIRHVRITGHAPEFDAELSSPADLAEFQTHWASKTKTPRASRGRTDAQRFIYALHVTTASGSQLWRFDPAGFALVLSMAPTPVYQFAQPAQLNRLLGIAPP